MVKTASAARHRRLGHQSRASDLAQATSPAVDRKAHQQDRLLGGDQLPLLEPHGGFLGVLWRSEP